MNSPSNSEPSIGRLIGDRQRYRLVKRLGAGGMGDVFLAMDTLLGQQVALKLIKDTLVAAQDLRKRFEREVALCAALKSDHIVEISDYGVTSEGHPFYVMEYLRGQSLGELLRQNKRLSVERTVGIITQVCEGLRLAHEGVTLWRDGATASEHIKVVHRDLKPDNIFLVSTSLGELVKILDFGIAKIRNATAEHTNLTSMFIGTYHYASPEQLKVEKELDGRADIYSLGIILYEVLSGTDPFGLGLNIHNISGASWVSAHTSKQPIPLRSQPGCEQLSPELETVVMRCLQKEAFERFASVDELKRELLAAVVAGGGISGTTNPRPMIPARQGVLDATSAQTLPSPGQGTLSETIPGPLTPTPSNPPHHKSPSRLLLIGSGIAIALALTGIYYLPWLSNQLMVWIEPNVKEPGFSLANTLAGHSDSVWSVTISPDGQSLASGSGDKTINIWRLDTGELLRTLSEHSDAVRAVAISPDGQTLASASGDKTIKIWRLGTGELLRTLSGHSQGVWSVAISPDGQTVVSGSYDGTIKLWRLGTGELLRTISGHPQGVWSVAISPNGHIASSGQDKTIKIWRLDSGKQLRTIPGHSDSVRAVAISSDGQILASGSWDKTIKIWNLHNGELLRTLSGHTSRVISVALSPDEQTLVSSSQDKTIKIWSVGTGELLRTFSSIHSDWVLTVAISPNGKTLVSGSKDQTIKIWQR